MSPRCLRRVEPVGSTVLVGDFLGATSLARRRGENDLFTAATMILATAGV